MPLIPIQFGVEVPEPPASKREVVSSFADGWADDGGNGYELTVARDGQTEHLIGYVACDDLTADAGSNTQVATLPDGYGDHWDINRPVIGEDGATVIGAVGVSSGSLHFTPARAYQGERCALQISASWPAA